MTDQDILNLFIDEKGFLKKQFTSMRWLTKHSDIYSYLQNRYQDSSCIQETIYRLKYGLEQRPTCKMCGNYVNFKCFSRGFSSHCSNKCLYDDQDIRNKINQTNLDRYGNICAMKNENVKNKAKQTNLDRYGVTSYTQTDEYIEKTKQTNLERYGVEWTGQAESVKAKSKDTCLKKYGCEYSFQSENNKEKSKNTWQEKYGVDNPVKSEVIQQQIKETCIKRYGASNYAQTEEYLKQSKQTCLEKYGDENYRNIDKMKETCNERYVVDFYMQTKEFKLLSNTTESKEKSKQTCLEKYGCDYYTQTEEYLKQSKQTCLEKYGCEYYSQTEEYLKKSYETKKINNSFCSSSIEKSLIEYLDSLNIDYKYQYRSDLYPFNCDFYFPQIDLYLEIQGSWTHGGMPYNENNEDCQKLLKIWQDKSISHPFYASSIKTWTERDVKKRNIAKQNNLNYLEIFSVKLDVVISILHSKYPTIFL